jgi:hypothetical protein
MGTREYKFAVGVETSAAPTATTPSASSDVLTKGYADTTYAANAPTIQGSGTFASPQAITAAGGLAFTGSAKDNIWFVKGTGAGTTDVSATDQIADGSFVGQKLKIVQRSATDFLKLETGNNLLLEGTWLGDAINRELNLWWTGTDWKEESRL